MANTKFGDTTTADCATGYLGTAVPGTCQAGGTWTDFTGCTLAGTKMMKPFFLFRLGVCILKINWQKSEWLTGRVLSSCDRLSYLTFTRIIFLKHK